MLAATTSLRSAIAGAPVAAMEATGPPPPGCWATVPGTAGKLRHEDEFEESTKRSACGLCILMNIAAQWFVTGPEVTKLGADTNATCDVGCQTDVFEEVKTQFVVIKSHTVHYLSKDEDAHMDTKKFDAEVVGEEENSANTNGVASGTKTTTLDTDSCGGCRSDGVGGCSGGSGQHLQQKQWDTNCGGSGGSSGGSSGGNTKTTTLDTNDSEGESEAGDCGDGGWGDWIGEWVDGTGPRGKRIHYAVRKRIGVLLRKAEEVARDTDADDEEEAIGRMMGDTEREDGWDYVKALSVTRDALQEGYVNAQQVYDVIGDVLLGKLEGGQMIDLMKEWRQDPSMGFDEWLAERGLRAMQVESLEASKWH